MASSAPELKENRPVFSCAGKDYTVRDIVEAAHFRGELAGPWKKFSLRCAAARAAEESDASLNESAVDEAAVAFRYQYDLITAEETEAWLEARGLNLAEFSDYFARQQWAENFAGKVEVPSTSFDEADEGERELFLVDLTLSGELDQMASRLAWRVAVAGETTDFGKMESAYAEHCEKALTKEARERELTTLRLPLTRFEVEMIELESRDAAREAFMCVRDDGMTMAEVAQEGRYPFREMQLVLEQIPDDMQQKFLSLKPGAVLEPTQRDDGFLLTRMMQKREPNLNDADVNERVEQQILSRYFSDLSSGRIRWRIMNGAS